MRPKALLGGNVDTRQTSRKCEMNAAQEQYVVDTNGKKMGVILSLKHYQQLMEDLHDLAVVAERREEKPVSLEEMKRRLKRDAIL
jgi:PHD/YefM family antitoxin component YafN of YafNO toxin-antitoxin module